MMLKINYKKVVVQLFALVALVGFIGLSTAEPVFADALSDRLEDVADSSDETSLVSNILKLAIPLGVISLVGLGSYAGFVMITSQGNPEKINEAREVFTNAVIGFAMIGLSVAILLLIQNVLKLPTT